MNESINSEKTFHRTAGQPPDHSPQLSPGSTIGQYRIIRLLGRGGMGEVYLAEHNILTTRHAVKLLPEERSGNAGFLARFHDEARVMAKLKHPGIVHVVHADEVQGRHYLVMDFVGADGGDRPYDLEDALAEAPDERLKPETVARLAIGICEAVGAAHASGVIHRDLKPANILLTSRDLGRADVRVADFGLARLMGEDWLRSRIDLSVRQSLSMGGLETMAKPRSERSSTGSILGTYEYMSPEQKEGKEADARSDVYGLGVMLYRMITGRRISGFPKVPSKLVPDLAAGWDDLIIRCLDEDPADRPTSMRDVSRELSFLVEVAEKKPAGEKIRKDRDRPERQAQERSRREQEAGKVAAESAVPTAKAGSRSGGRFLMGLMVAALVVGGVWWGLSGGQRGRAALTTTRDHQPQQQVAQPPRISPPSQNTVAPVHSVAGPALATKDKPWVNSLGMEFVPVAGVDALFCRWETRVQDFEEFVKETGYDATGGMYSLRNGIWGQNGDSWKSPGFTQGPTYPVCGVSYEDAIKFCEWLTEKEIQAGRLKAGQKYRLPTDAEWSVAVGLRGEQGGTPADKDGNIADVYPWNDGRGTWPPPRGAENYGGSLNVDNFDYTSPVGSFSGNQYGLYDMGGNVWEWCEDKYKPSEEWRVLRGASWSNDVSRYLLSSYRSHGNPVTRNDSSGFRVVLVP